MVGYLYTIWCALLVLFKSLDKQLVASSATIWYVWLISELFPLCATIYIAERRLSRIFTAIGARD
jgi:hypothetical protein